jgi:hypothetical protein
MGQAVEGNGPGRALELGNSVARPKKRAGLMAWKNDRWPQGCASSALGFILAPSQKRPGWSAFEDWENVETPKRGEASPSPPMASPPICQSPERKRRVPQIVTWAGPVAYAPGSDVGGACGPGNVQTSERGVSLAEASP